MEKKKSKYDGLISILYPLIFGAVIFILWQTKLLNLMFGIDSNTFPIPTKINSIIIDNFPKIMLNLKVTVIVAVFGIIVGSIVGYFVAIIATVFKKWGAGGLTLCAAFNAVPIVALAPVMNNLTKRVSTNVDYRSILAKTLVVMIVCIASMSINAFRGLTELKPFSEDLMKTYAASKFKTFIKLRLPNSVPYIFTALKVSVPAGIIAAVVSEYFSEKVIGVGRQIRENVVQAQFPTAWAYIMVSCILGILMYAVLIIFENILLRKRR